MNKYESVWDALSDTPEEAANMKARSEMMIAVTQAVGRMNVTQKAAAEALGITQPRINDLLQGRIERFSMDALFTLAQKSGLQPQFITHVPTARRSTAGTKHQARRRTLASA